MRILLLSILLLAAPLSIANAKNKPVPEVSMCYLAVADRHYEYVKHYKYTQRTHNTRNTCVLWRMGLQTLERHLQTCKEIWIANGKPKSETKMGLTDDVAAGVARYRAHTDCQTKFAYEKPGIQFPEH